MPCKPEVLHEVPLFRLLDDEETALLAAQVEVKTFAARQRIWKIGDPGDKAYILVSGVVRVTTIDEDHQEVVVDEPTRGDFFGFASMLEQTPHQTNAVAVEETECIEVDRHDISTLLEKKPHAGMDMLAVLGRQFHSAQQLVRLRSARNPNEVIEEKETRGERIADSVASFGGSWTFIIAFAIVLTVYTLANILLKGKAWDPYPFILLNLFLSMLAAVQAPIIMMSQNRQDKKDRLRSEMDFDVNRRAEAEIQALAHKMHMLAEKVDDFDDVVKGRRESTKTTPTANA
jgi:CRP/FNR family transcriptional regulator, cyclic AMP receptor protein